VDSISDDDSICTISFGVIRYTLLALFIGTAVFLVCFFRSSYHLISLSPAAIELYMEEDMKVILSSSNGLFFIGWGIEGVIY
jgi:hypothetical protein